MTGFGEADIEGVSARVVLTALNGRFTEINTNLPAGEEDLELDIRSRVLSCVSRGTVRVSVREDKSPVAQNALDASMVAEFLERFRRVAPEGIMVTFDPTHLLGVDAFARRSPLPREAFFEALDEALDALVAFRESEGKRIAEELGDLLKGLERRVKRFDELKTRESDERKKKLVSSLETLGEFEDGVLARELALMATKLDISEELSRLRSHLVAARETLDAKGACGKRLEFLCQEMGRELHTLSQKSLLPEIASLAIEAREVVERMRELSRNVE